MGSITDKKGLVHSAYTAFTDGWELKKKTSPVILNATISFNSLIRKHSVELLFIYLSSVEKRSEKWEKI